MSKPSREHTQSRLLWIEAHRDFGMDPQFKSLARMAKKHGLYSQSTNLGDIELSLRHTWHRRRELGQVSPGVLDWQI